MRKDHIMNTIIIGGGQAGITPIEPIGDNYLVYSCFPSRMGLR